MNLKEDQVLLIDLGENEPVTRKAAVTLGESLDEPRDRVIALHARSLTLTHPFSKEAMTWTAPLPDYWPPIGI